MEQSLSEEIERLRAEHRHLSDLLKLIQELTSGAVSSETEGDLFACGFAILSRTVPFDVGVAVMLEQNLDLHISTRAAADALMTDALGSAVRRELAALIPVSFESTEVIVKSEVHDLPEGPGEPGLTYHASALIEQGDRTAGLILLLRGHTAFSEPERQILSIFSSQMSMLLDTLHARRQIHNLADTDDLTGIWNRRYFRRELAHEVERARTFRLPLSLLLFDIDDFKDINDSFGHGLGDVVLSEVCGAVRETLRPTDTLARYGGDEFAVILPHSNRDAASAVASRLLSRVAALTITVDEETTIRCSVSVGVSELGEQDAGPDDLMRRADGKLYDSKRGGKNRYTA